MADVVARTMRQLRGQICWGLSYHPQTNLSMNFGEPRLEVIFEQLGRDLGKDSGRRPRPRWRKGQRVIIIEGRWKLEIRLAYWRIRIDRETTATSASPKIEIWRALCALEGQKFVGAEVEPTTGRTRFLFEQGSVLDVRRFERSSTDELWVLFRPTGYALAVRGDGTYDHEPSSGLDRRPRVERRDLPYTSLTTVPTVQVWS